MNPYYLLPLIPLFGWAIGDFFIQKTVRKVSILQSLFYICFVTFIVIIPFKYEQLINLPAESLFSLCGVGVLTFVYAVIQFRAMQVGKLSIVETIIGLELPMTVLIAINLGGEKISLIAIFFITLICIGVFMTSMKDLSHLRFHQHLGEKGVLLALAASIMSAFTNFFIGDQSQKIDPFITIMLVHGVVALLSLVLIAFNRELKETWNNIFKFPKIIFLQTFFDNIAWIGYAMTTTIMPISIAIAFSESYVVLAALLGFIFNKEKLNPHQKVGAAIALASVVVMSIVIKV